MMLSSLNNRFRSRTHVAIIRFQIALNLEESAPFSYTCHNFQVSECVDFEESVPFSYTCRNSQVSQCVEFQESAPFSYTCHNSQVSDCVEVTRAIACPTFVYGLACDYVVFAEGLSHHVQNSFLLTSRNTLNFLGMKNDIEIRSFLCLGSCAGVILGVQRSV